MATKTKIKTPAQSAPQTLEDVQREITELGNLSRERDRVATALNDAIAAITTEQAPHINFLGKQITALQGRIQIWCEAHRDEICGKGKTANLITGEVSWRARPPSVKVTGVEAVLAWLKNMGLTQFVRTKEEVNKDAILNEPEKATAIPGITIVSGMEDFAVVPFEVEAGGAV